VREFGGRVYPTDMRRAVIALLLLLTVNKAHAADRNRIRAVNIALQPIFTTMGAALQGKLRTRDDVLRCIGTGMVAGYGFYEAKEKAADGDLRTSWFIANAMASLNANAAAGRHPLSRLRFVLGPVRTEVRTGIGDDPDSAIVHVGLSLFEVGSLAYMNQQSDRMHMHDGMLTFSRNHKYELEGVNRDGVTAGIFPGLWIRAPQDIREHETIHAIQSLQLDSVEPPLCAFSSNGCDHDGGRLIHFELDLGVIPMIYVTALSSESYADRWSEVEAYRLAEDIAPIP